MEKPYNSVEEYQTSDLVVTGSNPVRVKQFFHGTPANSTQTNLQFTMCTAPWSRSSVEERLPTEQKAVGSKPTVIAFKLIFNSCVDNTRIDI